MLSLHNVNSYYGKAHILNDLGFTVERGQVAALLGRNGAGKTTTIKTIMRMVRASSGQITFADQDITRWPTHRIAGAGVGYVPEERRIFSDLTVAENMEVGRQAPRDGVPSWTIAELFDLFPNLRERQNNRGKALSGGEQQMLSIARTLMGNPSVLLLDEPSEGIAPVIVEEMANTILRLKQNGLTILLSEQNLHFARLVADRAIIIESGSKKFDGTFTELNAQPDVRDAYLSV